MLQSIKNKQTLEILKKMRAGGAPNKIINSSGEVDENAPPSPDENLNDIGFEMPDSSELRKKKLAAQKKKSPLDLKSDEDLAETADY